MSDQVIRALLVEDDEDDYIITRELFESMDWKTIQLDWASTYQAALKAIELAPYDIYFFDYRLGEGNGLALLGEALARGHRSPMILLTGMDDREIDMLAMKAGAADYLVKGQFDAKKLERTIRYALERRRAEEALVEIVLEDAVRAQEQVKQAELLAETDALTGIGNRRKAEVVMLRETASPRALSLLVFDLDGFKAVNDTYGHNQGDQLLKLVAEGIGKAVRDGDVVCRWGGDEFVVILPGCGLPEAERRAAEIDKKVFGEFVLDHASGSIRVTVGSSFGAAEHDHTESVAEFFERADKILLAKKMSRTRRFARVAETGTIEPWTDFAFSSMPKRAQAVK